MSNINNLEHAKIDNTDKEKIGIYLSWLPFSGLVISIALASIFLINRTDWSKSMVIYIFLPLAFQCLVYMIIKFLTKSKIKLSYPYFIGKTKYLSIFLSVLILGLIICLFIFNTNFDYLYINLSDLEKIETEQAQIDQMTEYYVLYSSANCIYCYEMEDVYQKAFSNNRRTQIYYVDLTNESIESNLVKKRNITKIPLLVYYKNGKEVDRLEGLQKLKTINDLLQ